MTAVAFALTALENGRRLGHALICAEARYATVQMTGAGRVDRRFVPAKEWMTLQRALSDNLPPGPIDAESAISVALLAQESRKSIIVQYLYALPIDAGPNAAVELDGVLSALSFEPSLRMNQPR